MINDRSTNTSQREREKMTYRYTSALERGDFETVSAVLCEAVNDAVLEQMILEINEVYQHEYEVSAGASDEALVNELLREHMPTAISNFQEPEAPSIVTVSEVIARLRSDVELTPEVKRDVDNVNNQLRRVDEPLPENLSQRGMRQFFEQLGLSVSNQFQKLFRETAIFLSMGRERQVMAATRRQKARQAEKSKEKKS